MPNIDPFTGDRRRRMAIIVRDHRGGNWFWMHNAIITEYGPQLGAYGIAIYAALCCHAGGVLRSLSPAAK